MSQALHTSSTGINAGQSQINVIANNVANINTTAYKAANATFETLFSNTISYGKAATSDGGGTNPKQIGLGTKIAGITRNFNSGAFVQTGRDTDLMISGSGFFVVQDADGKQYFTRDGIFSLDSAGNLVTNSGLKVVGAEGLYSNNGSTSTVKIPKNLKITVEPSQDLATKSLNELNNLISNIKTGDIGVTILADDGTTVGDLVLTIDDLNQTVADMVASFNAQIAQYENDHPGTNLDFDVSVNADGTISFNSATNTVTFNQDTTTSNFLGATGLSDQNTTSAVLNQHVTIQDMLFNNDMDATALEDITIDENGIVSAIYKDGSILTKFVDQNDAIQWKYISPEGVEIVSGDVTTTGSVLSDSNFIIELATMVNQEGLVSINQNLWEWGPDVGEIYYGIAGEMAFGSIETGGYEGSNVDIAFELSNMITAQRMIQMNSRVFSTASTVMETLAYLGQ